MLLDTSFVTLTDFPTTQNSASCTGLKTLISLTKGVLASTAWWFDL